MSNKYNRLPGASHFEPFFSGPTLGLHFSYRGKNMYCRSKHKVDDLDFEYVEVRHLDTASKQELDCMSADDFVGPMRIFGSLSGNPHDHEQLEQLFYGLRMTKSALSELAENLDDMDPESDDYADTEAQLEGLREQANEETSKIEEIISNINRNSGYDPKTRTISPTR